MRKLQHTLGPWRAERMEGDGFARFDIISDNSTLPVGDYRSVATIDHRLCYQHWESGRAEANANLLALAPELLTALRIVCEASQLAVSALDSDDPGAQAMVKKFWRSLEPARAALAKLGG